MRTHVAIVLDDGGARLPILGEPSLNHLRRVVDAISAVATGPGDRPIEPVVISSIDIASV